MLGVDPRLQHDGVERNYPGMIGDDQRRTLVGNVLKPARLYPEPVPVQRQGGRHDHRRVKVRIEAERIDLVVARKSALVKVSRAGQPSPPARPTSVYVVVRRQVTSYSFAELGSSAAACGASSLPSACAAS